MIVIVCNISHILSLKMAGLNSKQLKIFCGKQYQSSMALLVIFCAFSCLVSAHQENKYSKEANKESYEPITYINFRTLEKPFRMAKLNVLWSKAQLRLTDTKLKSLFSEMKIHDKEELMWKKLRHEGGDEDGLKEAELRKKLTGIMSSYGLLHHFEDIHDPAKLKEHRFEGPPSFDNNKSLFNDQRLNHLWSKAEKAGFTAEELQALKEEFSHHQEKIDQYYSMLSNVNKKTDQHENTIAEDLDKFNSLTQDEEEKRFDDRVKELRELHHDVKDGYDRLYRITAKGPNSQEFIEPQVQGLWRQALAANFSNEELLSLKSELLHYENRLLKLRHLHAESAANADRDAAKVAATNEMSEGMKLMSSNIKKSQRKVEKLRLDLETRIMAKHLEL